MKILIVEDDQATSLGLYKILTEQNYTVNLVTDGQKALEFASQFEYDLIVLDIIIPKVDGISVCKHLRNSGYQNPILLLTAKNASDDRVIGLDAGADDYVVKPFDLPEFLARIRALLRRGKSVITNVTIWENLQLDTVNSEVTCNGQRIHFTPKEYCLLELFFLNPKRIYNRTTILDKLWDFADSPGEETVSTHIKCLRQKLKAAGASDPIETVHGLGYRLRQENNAKTESIPESTQAKETLESTSNIKNKTLKTWGKYQNIISQQVSILEEATQALITSSITSDVRQRAKDEAHKLAGSLGLFGLKQGSVFARDLENLLQPNINLKELEVQQIIAKIKLLRVELDNAEVTLKGNQSPNNFPLILIVDDDLFLADQVRVEAMNWGMRVEVATDLNIARKIITQTPPDVILLDLNFPSTQEHGLNLLHDLATQNPNISIIAFTGSQSLADRVEVARLGGCAFLHKPLPAYKIFNAIIEALNKKQLTHGARVLLVDDDILVLECLSNHLRDLGAEVETLKNSNQFWEVLTTFKPNLLVLDLKMPDFDGIQLCQAVRTDPYWQHLPIVFVCNNTDQTEIDTCLGAGANDYISKSTNLDEIANRIFRRLQHDTLHKIAYREDLVTKKGK